MCSLPIHIPQCIDKWEKTEALKPRRERRPVPQAPVGFGAEGALPSSARDIDAFNEAMYHQYENVSLQQCENCGRSFK